MDDTNVNILISDLLDENFQMLQHKYWKMKTDELDNLFFGCTETMIDTISMAQTFLADEFANNDKNRVLVITHKTNCVLNELLYIIQTKKIKKFINTSHIYFTLSEIDLQFKFRLLYEKYEIHDIFWSKLKENSPLFIASNHSFSIETNLNQFYDDTRNQLELETKYYKTQCCCQPIVQHLEEFSRTLNNVKCVNIIDKAKINNDSKKCYCQAIEKQIDQNVTISGSIMNIIWDYLGPVIDLHTDLQTKKSNDSTTDPIIYRCPHCKKSFKLNTNNHT